MVKLGQICHFWKVLEPCFFLGPVQSHLNGLFKVNCWIIKYKYVSVLWRDFIYRYYSVFMSEREENAPFSLISYSKERRFRVFQTLPDSWKNKKLIQVLTWFLKLVYYRDYLSKIWRNSKIHDCQPILENYRHWLLSRSFSSSHSMFCWRPDCEAVFRWGEGESVHTRKTRTEILPLIFMGILKTNTSVFRLEDGRRKGFKHPKSRGKKLFL